MDTTDSIEFAAAALVRAGCKVDYYKRKIRIGKTNLGLRMRKYLDLLIKYDFKKID